MVIGVGLGEKDIPSMYTVSSKRSRYFNKRKKKIIRSGANSTGNPYLPSFSKLLACVPVVTHNLHHDANYFLDCKHINQALIFSTRIRYHVRPAHYSLHVFHTKV